MHVFGVIITVLVTVSEREPFTDIVHPLSLFNYSRLSLKLYTSTARLLVDIKAAYV